MRLKHFIIQQMHKYVIRRYNYNYYKIFKIFKIALTCFGSQGIHHQGTLYSNGSISSVDMDVVGVMAAYLPVVRVCTAQSREALPL